MVIEKETILEVLAELSSGRPERKPTIRKKIAAKQANRKLIKTLSRLAAIISEFVEKMPKLIIANSRIFTGERY